MMALTKALKIVEDFKEWEHGFEGRTRILTAEFLEAQKVIKEQGRILTPPIKHVRGRCTCIKCKKAFFESMGRASLIAISRTAHKETGLFLKAEFAEGLYWVVSEEKRYRLEDNMNDSISIIKHFKEKIKEIFNHKTVEK